MSRRSHQPDPSQRRQVEAMAAYGIPETDVARTVGIDPKTLRKCYREELDLGTAKANAQVAGFLFNSAKNGNVTAQIFWLKTRARWKESPTDLNHTVSADIESYSKDELEDHLMKQIGNLPGLKRRVWTEYARDGWKQRGLKEGK